MFKNYTDRLIAEEAWAEYWQELQADDEALRLWEAAQAFNEKACREDYFGEAFEAMRNAIEGESERDGVRDMLAA